MSCQARALLLDADLTLRLGVITVLDPLPNEVRVRVRWAGVGDADLAVIRGGADLRAWPAVLGREVMGDVDAVGNGVVGLEPGQPVVLDPRVPCLACQGCAEDPNACRDPGTLGRSLPGGFAEFVTVPEPMVHDIPESIDGALAILAAPLAVALHVIGGLLNGRAPIVLAGYGTVSALINLELRRSDPEREIVVVERDLTRAAVAEAHGATVVDGLELCGEGVIASAKSPPTRFTNQFPLAIQRLVDEPMRYRSVITEHVAILRSPARVASEAHQPRAVGLLLAL